MNFIKKIIKALTPISQEELDQQYLNEATSVHDVEWRMQQIDRANANANRNRNFANHTCSY